VSKLQNKFCLNLITTPVAPQRKLRVFFLMAQPPLLGEEGKIPNLLRRADDFDASFMDFYCSCLFTECACCADERSK
jgi:hypothetical protein